MLDTGRGGHHEEVRTLTATGQGPGLYRRGTAATGGRAAPARGLTAGGSSAGRTTVGKEGIRREDGERGHRERGGGGGELRVRGTGQRKT